MITLWGNLRKNTVITYKQLPNITFPVYRLPSTDWYSIDGLLFLEGQIIDDRNMPGDSLGVRRLQSPMKDMYKLNKRIDTLAGMLKQKNKYFIDSKGNTFIYETTEYMPLRYYKIVRIDKRIDYSTLWLEGVNSGFSVPRPPDVSFRWAGLLHLRKDIPWILYEYSDKKLPDTRRKV